MKNDNPDKMPLSNESYTQISERLYILRKDILHLNQPECAKVLGISQTLLSLIESGKRKPTAETISLYVGKFNANIQWIMYGDDSLGIINSKEPFDIDTYTNKKRHESINLLKDAFNLDKTEIDFFYRLLSQDTAKRKRFIKSLKDLKDMI